MAQEEAQTLPLERASTHDIRFSFPVVLKDAFAIINDNHIPQEQRATRAQ